MGPPWGSALAGLCVCVCLCVRVRVSETASAAFPLGPASPAGGRYRRGFSPQELQPEWCLPTNSSQK